MTVTPSDSTLLSTLSSAGLNINPAKIPAKIQNGDAAAQKAYGEGLAFEQVLVSQFTRQLANAMSSSDPSDQSGAGGGSGDSTGLLGGNSSMGPYASLIPQALTSSIMNGGGLGIAEEVAESIDPAIKYASVSNKPAS
jgi:hypothetical protein